MDKEKVSAFTITDMLSRLDPKQQHTLTVRESSESTVIFQKVFSCKENCSLGILHRQSGNVELLPIKFSFPQAMLAGVKEIKAEWDLTIHSLGQL